MIIDDKVKAEAERKFDLNTFPVVKGQGAHNLKGIPDQVAIYELLPRSLMSRFFPPLRTINNEKKEKEERKKAKEAQKEEKKRLQPATTNGTSTSTGNGNGTDATTAATTDVLSPSMGDRKGIKVVVTRAVGDSPSAPSTPRGIASTPTSATSSPSSAASSVASSIGLPTASPRGSLNVGSGAALVTTPRHARNSAVHTITQTTVTGLLATDKPTPPESPAITPAATPATLPTIADSEPSVLTLPPPPPVAQPDAPVPVPEHQ
jgi:hypothetical protein